MANKDFVNLQTFNESLGPFGDKDDVVQMFYRSETGKPIAKSDEDDGYWFVVSLLQMNLPIFRYDKELSHAIADYLVKAHLGIGEARQDAYKYKFNQEDVTNLEGYLNSKDLLSEEYWGNHRVYFYFTLDNEGLAQVGLEPLNWKGPTKTLLENYSENELYKNAPLKNLLGNNIRSSGRAITTFGCKTPSGGIGGLQVAYYLKGTLDSINTGFADGFESEIIRLEVRETAELIEDWADNEIVDHKQIVELLKNRAEKLSEHESNSDALFRKEAQFVIEGYKNISRNVEKMMKTLNSPQ